MADAVGSGLVSHDHFPAHGVSISVHDCQCIMYMYIL